MAVTGTLVTNAPSGPGWWTECTLATAVAVTGTTTATTSIVYNNTSARVLQPSLPVGLIIPSLTTATSAATVAYTTLQNSTNNVLAVQSTVTGGIAVAGVALGVTAQQTNTSTSLVSYSETGTLTLTFVNAGATSTLTAGTRLLFFQSQGN
jgi:hypothetical protein